MIAQEVFLFQPRLLPHLNCTQCLERIRLGLCAEASVGIELNRHNGRSAQQSSAINGLQPFAAGLTCIQPDT